MAKYYVDVNEVNGGTFWFKDEEMKICHREHGPAREYLHGDKFWYKDGKIHREDGPALEYFDGSKIWMVNGKIHREDGPAIEYSYGYKAWYIDGKYHRDDGPAREFANGDVQYWLNNQQLPKQQWEDAVQPVEEMTVAQIEKLLGKRIKVIK